MGFHALIIEPEHDVRRLMQNVLEQDGWMVTTVSSEEEAATVMCRHKWSLVFCAIDLRTNNKNSRELPILEVMRECLEIDPHIIVTGKQENFVATLEAILSGASDYLGKPFTEDDLREQTRAVMQRLHAANTKASLLLTVQPHVQETNSHEPELIGKSEIINNIFKTLARSLRKDAHHLSGNNKMRKSLSPSFLITGETGTGKELFARLIHEHSDYQKGPFIAINCSELPSELVESELFGYERGAFTGAIKAKKGLWESANGGTLFLDEITEASIVLQPKLLRVLQDGKVKRIGSNSWRGVDVQVIAASNREIKTEIEEGRFRHDLYHRLSLYHIHLPPLRERREDILLLVAYFAARYGDKPVQFSQEAMEILQTYSWPGNVRELENVVRACISQSIDGNIFETDILSHIDNMGGHHQFNAISNNEDENSLGQTLDEGGLSLEEQVKKFKLKVVQEALKRNKGNVTRAATALGLTRPTLYKLLKEL